jgi:hypothetical protein
MPLPARRSTAFWLSISLVGWLLVGCGNSPQVAEESPAPRPAAELEYPGDFQESRLALYNDDAKLNVGDSALSMNEVFPKPPRSYMLNDRPPRLPMVYATRGWQTNEEAVSAILVEDHIAAFVRTREGVELSDVEEAIAEYERLFGEPTRIVNGDYRFAFWSDSGAALMIGNAIDLNGRMSMTYALGHPELLKSLNMTVADAQSQVQVATERREAARRAASRSR